MILCMLPNVISAYFMRIFPDVLNQADSVQSLNVLTLSVVEVMIVPLLLLVARACVSLNESGALSLFFSS